MKRLTAPTTLSNKAIQVSIHHHQGMGRVDYINMPCLPYMQNHKARPCRVLPNQQSNKILFVSNADYSVSILATAICNAFQSQTTAKASVFDNRGISKAKAKIMLQKIDIETEWEILPLSPQTIQHFPLVMVLGHERECPEFLLKSQNVLFHPITCGDRDLDSLNALKSEIESIVVSLFHTYLMF